MNELLLELFSEEIPAMMQKGAEVGFKEIFIKYFAKHEVRYDNLAVYVTPRRVTIHVTGLPSSLDRKEIEIKGPKTGAPIQAIEGFCRSNNVTAERLIIKEFNGTDYYFIRREIPEINTRELLLETLAEPIGEYVWPKSMRWSDYKIKWVRPLKNILCVFGGRVLPFKYGHLTADNFTYGHRFLAPEKISPLNFNEYREILKKRFVVLDREERKESIKISLELEAKSLNLELKEDAALLEEVAGLVEYPVVLKGEIDKKFLTVPYEILIASMRSNQKYFCLFDKEGNFAPYFLFVSNIISDVPKQIIAGNEKVLSARLSDALYFWERDSRDEALEKRQEKLKSIIFHAKLGTVYQKCERIKNIINNLDFEKFCTPILTLDNIYPDQSEGGKIEAEHYKVKVLPKLLNAAMLCKNDIAGELAGEFPELQGIIGYRLDERREATGKITKETENTRFSEAIRDHYRPLGPSDQIPVGPGAILAVADKLDTAVGLFLAGERPTGSGDPYALRRQVLGVIRIILELDELSKKNHNRPIHIKLKDLVEFCANQYKNLIDEKSVTEGINLVTAFLEDRVRYYLKDKYDTGIINATLDFNKESDLSVIRSNLITLNKLVMSENGQLLISLYKRAKNILEGQKPQGNAKEIDSVSSADIKGNFDNNLFKCLGKVKENINKPLNDGDLEKALIVLSDFSIPVTQFFDNVLVLDDSDTELKNNRLCLLREITELFEKAARFDLL